jgi:trehalose 6-phosphate phosphatase
MGTNIFKGLKIMKADLEKKLKQIAQTPVLLVASDYDGTIAPIVSNPEDALPHPESMVALKSLGKLSLTHTAIISGRSLKFLTSLSHNDIHMV